MNHLNSIILEGNVKSRRYKVIDGLLYAFIEIASERVVKKDDKNVTIKSVFNARATGTVADIMKRNATVGRGIRIVGRLAEVDSNVYVFIEHAEFKVKKAKKNSKIPKECF